MNRIPNKIRALPTSWESPGCRSAMQAFYCCSYLKFGKTGGNVNSLQPIAYNSKTLTYAHPAPWQTFALSASRLSRQVSEKSQPLGETFFECLAPAELRATQHEICLKFIGCASRHACAPVVCAYGGSCRKCAVGLWKVYRSS